LYGGYNSQTTALLGGNGIIQTTDISHNLTEYVTTEVGIAFTFNTDNTGKVGIGKLIPTKTLDVGGDINFSGSLYQNGSIVNIGSSTFNQNTDLTINSLTTVSDISFAGNLYQNGALFTSGGGVSNGDDISFNNMDISGVLRGTSGYNNNQLSLGSHIIPTSNASFDLGSAEYKIRHLFLSDNSLWIGDDHKIDISGGKMKFKKRKKTAIPKNISDLGGDHANINTIITNTAGVSSIEEMTLHHWHDYTIQHSLDIAGKGAGNASIEDIFSSNHPDDWDNDDELDTWTRNGSNINYSNGNVGIGTPNPITNFDVYESGTTGWTGRGYFGNQTLGTIFGVYGNKVQFGGHTRALDSWTDIYLNPSGSSTIYHGTMSLFSDDRIKHNEVIVSKALSILSNINPKRYFKTTGSFYDASHNFQLNDNGIPIDNSGNTMIINKDYNIEIGIIAQEMRTIPELRFAVKGEDYTEETITTYRKDNSGNDVLDESGNKIVESVETQQQPNSLAIDYNSIHCIHIAATKELHQLVEEQQQADKAKIAELETKIASQDTIIQSLISRIETLENN
jgi:hypothetical protein